MPTLGEIKKGTLLGFKDAQKRIWCACIDCGRERWIPYSVKTNKTRVKRCIPCRDKILSHQNRGSNHPQWLGGRVTKHGYMFIWLPLDNFFYSMADKTHYVPEHRLVMAQNLKRCLQRWEVVHHINGIKTDNRIENLELCTNGFHHIEHTKGYRDGFLKGYTDGRSKRIKELEKELRICQWAS